MSQPTESKVIELAKEEALLLAGTTASTHEDAYVDSGTSPPTSERLPEGYVDCAAASHNLQRPARTGLTIGSPTSRRKT